MSKLIETSPEYIWLQVSDDDDIHEEAFPDEHYGISWCAEEIFSCDVKYVRADIVDELKTKLAELKAANEIK